MSKETKPKTTKEAFSYLIGQVNWYKGLVVNGREITPANASKIKSRFVGKAKEGIIIDYMEKILTAAGAKVVTEKTWIL